MVGGWINRLLIVLVWLGLTAGVAFLVSRQAVNDADPGLLAPVPLIADQPRATVTLTDQRVSPVVSGEGSVVWDEAEDRWLLVAPAFPADLAYRLLDPPVGVRALIHGGPSGFDCAWAGLAPADGSSAVPSSLALPREQAGVQMRCVIPDDVRVVAGMTGMMVLTLEEPVIAPALPLTAVLGSAERGQVVVVAADGATTVREVELGRSDAFWIEVVSGLEPDETVLEVPTQSDLDRGA